MKTIEVDDELYHYIASRTQAIGESASDILRRLLRLPATPQPFVLVQETITSSPKKKTAAKPQEKIAKRENTVEKVESLLNSSRFKDEKKGVNRFLLLLSVLYQANPKAFAQATENVQGSERIYFAREEKTILATGSSPKAKLIPSTPFWVITNNNTERKGIILCALMNAMALPESLIQRVKAQFSSF